MATRTIFRPKEYRTATNPFKNLEMNEAQIIKCFEQGSLEPECAWNALEYLKGQLTLGISTPNTVCLIEDIDYFIRLENKEFAIGESLTGSSSAKGKRSHYPVENSK